MSWALVVAAPLMVTLSWMSLVRDSPDATAGQWASFAYLSIVSMFLGFFAWYRGLAIGPMAKVSQIQLVQPVLSICWAALLLGERIDATTAIGGLVVIACAAGAVRSRLMRDEPGRAPDTRRVRARHTVPAAAATSSQQEG